MAEMDNQKLTNYGDITDEESLLIMRILMYGITPGISVFGIAGNIFSIIILRKHGLHKCSNILLFCLAVADLTFLIAFSGIPKIVYVAVGIENSWECSKDVCYVAYIWFNIFNVLDYTMSTSSLCIPMLITIERLFAVLLPFKFSTIITPTRTWCAAACVYLFWLGVSIYMSLWFKLEYTYSKEYNITLGVMERTELYNDNPQDAVILEYLIDYLCMKIPPAITLAGCIIITVKVKMTSIHRKKLTNTSFRESSSPRTTKMLLAVCGFYLITCFVMSLPVYIPLLVHWTLISDAPTNIAGVMYQVTNTVMCINSSVNFIIYVGMNKKFRDTYRSLFPIRIRSK